jgi:hypothetical protein
MNSKKWIEATIISPTTNNHTLGELNLDHIDYYEKSATNSTNTRIITSGGHKLVITLTVAQLREKIQEASV